MADTVVFFHAHPDDEAIFTGGTMTLAAQAGHNVVLVVATKGEQGTPRFPLPSGESIADRRVAETRAAATLMGVSELHFLGYRDSGVEGSKAEHHDDAFGRCDVDRAARQLAAICRHHEARALVAYDPGGIYAHPDHLMVHRVGMAAGRAANVDTVYQATVDHEYLHFVDVHLVEGANRSLADRTSIGLPTAMISTAIDCRPALETKWRAMAAHASQIPDADPDVPPAQFQDVYGWEWFVRDGPRGVIESLA